MVDSYITLISETDTGEKDAFLQPIKTEKRTSVLAADVPVSRTEYYKAGELGIKPEFEFVINPVEYHGETVAEVTDDAGNLIRVRIYRTYKRNADELEIYCSQSAGLNERGETNE